MDGLGRVVFEGDRVVVIDKPAGVTSEDLAASWQRKLVHRIDKATSGLVVVADDARTVQRLHRQLQAGAVERTYAVVVHGALAAQTITSRLVRDRGDGLRGSMGGDGARREGRFGLSSQASFVGVGGVSPPADEGQLSTTIVHALSTFELDGVPVTAATATLVTGRTHQIRIQLAEAGHLLVGEPVYRRDHVARGAPEVQSDRLLLHAWRLRFTHPTTHQPLALEAAIPVAFPAACVAVFNRS